MTAVERRRRGRWVPGMIALGALLAIGIVVGAGADLTHPSPHSLDGNDVASQVALGVQAEKLLEHPPEVHCPSSEPVRTGLTFHCTVTALGSDPSRVVEVTEIDGRGHLRWRLNPP